MEKEKLKQKIMEKVEIDHVSGCWNWRGGFLKSGIPYISINRKTRTVRRELFTIEIGDIFDRQIQVRCSCGNTSCVSPNHMELRKGNLDAVKKFQVKKYKSKKQKDAARKRNRHQAWLNKKEKLGIPDKKYNFGDWNEKRKKRKTCKHGHSLKDSYINKGGRVCRTCSNLAVKAYREKNRKIKNDSR